MIASVSENDIPLLTALPAKERRWTIHFPANTKLKPVAGHFEVLGTIIEPKQRTASVIGWIDNPDGRLSAGQSITAEISLTGEKHTGKKQIEGGNLNGILIPGVEANRMVTIETVSSNDALLAAVRAKLLDTATASILTTAGSAVLIGGPYHDFGANYLDQFPDQVYGKPTSELKAGE